MGFFSKVSKALFPAVSGLVSTLRSTGKTKKQKKKIFKGELKSKLKLAAGVAGVAIGGKGLGKVAKSKKVRGVVLSSLGKALKPTRKKVALAIAVPSVVQFARKSPTGRKIAKTAGKSALTGEAGAGLAKKLEGSPKAKSALLKGAKVAGTLGVVGAGLGLAGAGVVGAVKGAKVIKGVLPKTTLKKVGLKPVLAKTGVETQNIIGAVKPTQPTGEKKLPTTINNIITIQNAVA